MSKKNGGQATEGGKEVARWNATLHGRGRRGRPGARTVSICLLELMSIKRRLSGLEKAASETAESEPPWSPPEVYARLHREAQAEIGQALEGGEEPLFWIDDAGSIRAVDDDSLVRHLGDYVRAGDRKMRRLEREIAEDRASMTLEEIQQANAEDKELRAALSKLSLDEAIAFLEAEISILEAEEPGGGG